MRTGASLVGVVLAILLCACGSPRPPAPTYEAYPTPLPAPGPPQDQQCQRLLCARPYHSPYEVTIETSPSPMSYKGRTTFTVRVKDPGEQSTASVMVGLWAAHGSDPRADAGPVALDRVGNGLYRGSLFLPQKGSYQITVGVRGARGEGDHAFDLYTVI
jgi:hypothetical protein